MLTPFLTLPFLTLVWSATVKLGETTINGTDIPGANVELFGGIPFAEPPLGKLRFAPPVLKTSLDTDLFDASTPGIACLGLFTGLNISIPMSEDCLTLNIYRPAGIAPSAKLPVMAWIYGSGFVGGIGNIYDGSSLIAHSVARGTPVIFVGFNYRVGPFGFPQGTEAASKGALNVGLKDSLTALKWIQANIGTFGGDKSKVTVFGESAGAVTIGLLYFNSGLEGLVRAAILVSGSATLGPVVKPAKNDLNWAHFTAAVPECSSLASTENTFDCLRNASSAALLNAFGVAQSQSSSLFAWLPLIDGPKGVIPDLPRKLIELGKFSRIPLIAGTSKDEGTYFATTTTNLTDDVRNYVSNNWAIEPSIPAHITDILKLYPDIPELGCPFGTGDETFGLSSQYKRLAAIGGDLFFHAGKRLWIENAAKVGVKSFGYYLTDPAPAAVPPRLGVTHGLAGTYFFPTVLPMIFTGAEFDEGAKELGRTMADYWISFAVTGGDPNDGKGGNRMHWPQYTPQKNVLLRLDHRDLGLVKDDYRQEQIAFLNSIIPK